MGKSKRESSTADAIVGKAKATGWGRSNHSEDQLRKLRKIGFLAGGRGWRSRPPATRPRYDPEKDGG
jgi:hypothetical protein